MANTPPAGQSTPATPPATTSAGTREPATGATESLDPSEVKDSADNSPRVEAPEVKGKRVRAIPYKGGTQIELSKADFASGGIDHPAVKWDVDKLAGALTVPVWDGNGDEQPKNTLTVEAAKFLTENHGHTFEYIDA